MDGGLSGKSVNFGGPSSFDISIYQPLLVLNFDPLVHQPSALVQHRFFDLPTSSTCAAVIPLSIVQWVVGKSSQ